MDVYEKLKKLGLTLPEAPAKGGVYTPAKRFGQNLIYVSGCGPAMGGELPKGKLGAEISLEEGQRLAQNCVLNILAVLEKELGDLNRITGAVKMLAFVASTDDFTEQPKVANGASGLLVELFGEENGAPTRSAIGVNVLPGNIPVEVEGIFEIQ